MSLIITVNNGQLNTALTNLKHIDPKGYVWFNLNFEDEFVTLINGSMMHGVQGHSKIPFDSHGLQLINAFGVPFKNIIGFSNLMEPSDSIKFEVGGKVKVSVGKSRATFPLLGTVEVDPVEIDISLPSLKMSKDEFDTIQRMTTLTGTDHDVFAGIYAEAKDSKLMLLATNKFAMMQLNLSLSSPVESVQKTIIPSSVFSEIKEDVDTIALYVGKNTIQIVYEDTWITSSVLVGDYPAEMMKSWLDKPLVKLFDCETKAVKQLSNAFKVIDAKAVRLTVSPKFDVIAIGESEGKDSSFEVNVGATAHENSAFSYLLSAFYTTTALSIMSNLNQMFVTFSVTNDANAWIVVKPNMGGDDVTIAFARMVER